MTEQKRIAELSMARLCFVKFSSLGNVYSRKAASIVILPFVLLICLYLEHEFMLNKQAFLQGRALFSTVVTMMPLLYGTAVILSVFYGPCRAWLKEKAPLISAAIGLVILWDLVTLKFALLPLPYFPSPGVVLGTLVSERATLAMSVLYSLRLLFLGYFFGLLVGLPTGVLMGWSSRFHYWVNPALKLIGPIPATAWIPLAMVVFPSSFTASIFLIALSCWFPVTVMTSTGIANVNKSYYEVARSLGASEWYLVRCVAIPAALPNIFVGLFMGLGMAFVTLIVGEMLGVKAGLGWFITWAQGWAEYGKVYAALIVMSILFSGIITVLFTIRDRVLAWQKGLIKW
jgi:NitT/TauT family transport system permease protein